MASQLIVIGLVIEMAHDYSIETRVRRLIEAYYEDGVQPRTLVMNVETWKQMVWELEGRTYSNGYFWVPSLREVDPERMTTTFLGIPILIKDYVADQEVLVGV